MHPNVMMAPTRPRWALLSTGSVSGGNCNFASAGIENYEELYLTIAALVHDSTAAWRLAASADGGSSFANIAVQFLQFSSGSEARNAYISSNQNGTSSQNYQGSARVMNIAAAYKQVILQSNIDAASGQGSLSIGTIELTSAINYLRLSMSTGNLTSVTAKLYGR